MAAVHAAGPEPMMTTFSGIAVSTGECGIGPRPPRTGVDAVFYSAFRTPGLRDAPPDRPPRNPPLRAAVPRPGVRHRRGRGDRRGRQLPEPPPRHRAVAEPERAGGAGPRGGAPGEAVRRPG